MGDDITPSVRMSMRVSPGESPREYRTFGRSLWLGTTRFISFMGGMSRPFAEAWALSNGPGAQGAIVVANFMQKFGDPHVQNINSPVYAARTQLSPYVGGGVDVFNTENNSNNTVRISTETTEATESHLAEHFDVMRKVIDTRYDAVTGSAGEVD